jgi:Family of unknown function (DUF5984)
MASLDNQAWASQFRISFDLDEIERVGAWGNPGEHKLHWFGLTSGRYWIETQCGSPVEYTTAIQEYWSHGKYPDYYVVRLFEDLLGMLAAVLEPVPSDIANLVANPGWRTKAKHWCDASEDGQRRYPVLQWWDDRSLDMGYLRYGPRLTFWRVGETVFLQWKADGKHNGIPVWVVSEGQVSMNVTVFEAAVTKFCEELLESMEQRVRRIQQHGWQRTDCTLDLEGLVSEQMTRREFFHKMQNAQQATDWHQVRSYLGELLGLMGEPNTNRS